MYVGSLYARDAALDAAAPLYGVGLLLTAELASWSLELRTPALRGERRRLVGRLSALALVALAGLVLGGILLALARVQVGRSLALEAVALLCAVAVLGLVAWLARRGEG